ncbi:amino acid permease [Lactobacillus crispatus]|jgi:amino acid permease|uniref:amino acid permease n=1 Tax=Lactobacillus crispatus TaxID=47770 RepID=UPI000760CCC7|nr:amino acid permease [Lactobacillus crispatus]KWU08554.1 D-alanine/D-serine/glycine permease [Lactobacillus crispatus]MCT7721741.1 amino acid permease [Lactobacillus crispatus]MCT7754749.1 amino acid permease [Lactobacillus crispatus]MCT7828909.1 amino acid permease [Lactobacillus crispatus]MCT7870184.1 amino acid permease [Lactobacillus crispatus]
MAKKAPELKRSMTAGQMEMISLGGAIGVGLFMGASSTIKWTGPSVLLAYIFVGVILYIVMRALGEMLYVDPGTGSFADYASEHVHPIAGYLAEWANVFQYIVVGISEVVATTEYLRFWWKGTSDWVAGVIIILFLLVANLASAKAYATLEFWFAMIKVVTIILMILLGFAVILFGFGNGGHPVGFSNLWSHGGFFTGGLNGFFFSMAIIVGSYEGIELIGISAGEVSDPHKAIVKSVKSVLWRILIFYVGAIFVIVTIYPWNKLDSIGSPFVTTFAKVGITAAASVINFVVLTAALSGANSGIYSSSRMLYKLAHEGEAPKTFGHVSKRIVPSHAIIGITSGIFIGFMLNVLAQFLNKSLANIFVIVYSSSVLPGMVAWFVILLAELRFRRKNPHLMENHPFKLPLYPYSNYFALIMLVVIVVFMFINPETQISVAVGAAVLIIAALVYVVKHRKDK